MNPQAEETETCPMSEKFTLHSLEDALGAQLGRVAQETSGSGLQLQAYVKQVFDETIQEAIKLQSKSYRDHLQIHLNSSRQSNLQIEDKVESRWKPAVDRLGLVFKLALKLGQKNGEEFHEISPVSNDLVFVALTELFPKALLVSQEILCLLRGGLSDGAHARWRTLHEILVTARYLTVHGNSAALAYLMSYHFSNRRAAIQYNLVAEKNGEAPLTEHEMRLHDSVCFEAEQLLGKEIKKPQDGEWPRIFGKHRDFAAMEKSVDLEFWRPHYRSASKHTHAVFREPNDLLGHIKSSEKAHLVGPSIEGLGVPIINTARTLADITLTYLMWTPNADRIMHSEALRMLADELPNVVFTIEDEIRGSEDTGVS